MSAADQSKEFATLIRRLRADHGTDVAGETAPPALIEPGEPMLAELVRSMLMWEATAAKSDAAFKRFHEAVVDFNELRICLVDELIRMMGERYPRAEERAQRLRAALNDIFLRNHCVSLEHLSRMGKRESREYLDTLDGVPRFAASRVFLLCLGGHAAPVDGRILRRLIEAGIVEPGATPESAASVVERSVRAGELLETYQLLQAWADALPLTAAEPAPDAPRPKRDSRSAAAPEKPDGKKRPASRPAAKDPVRRRSGGE